MGQYDGGQHAVPGVVPGGPTLTVVWHLSCGWLLQFHVWTHSGFQWENTKLTFHSSACHLLSEKGWPSCMALECGWGQWDRNQASVSLSLSRLPLVLRLVTL